MAWRPHRGQRAERQHNRARPNGCWRFAIQTFRRLRAAIATPSRPDPNSSMEAGSGTPAAALKLVMTVLEAPQQLSAVKAWNFMVSPALTNALKTPDTSPPLFPSGLPGLPLAKSNSVELT